MNSENEKNRDQNPLEISEIIDEAVENAEARRELSEDELDDVAGGSTMSTDGGPYYKQIHI